MSLARHLSIHNFKNSLLKADKGHNHYTENSSQSTPIESLTSSVESNGEKEQQY